MRSLTPDKLKTVRILFNENELSALTVNPDPEQDEKPKEEDETEEISYNPADNRNDTIYGPPEVFGFDEHFYY